MGVSQEVVDDGIALGGGLAVLGIVGSDEDKLKHVGQHAVFLEGELGTTLGVKEVDGSPSGIWFVGFGEEDGVVLGGVGVHFDLGDELARFKVGFGLGWRGGVAGLA